MTTRTKATDVLAARIKTVIEGYKYGDTPHLDRELVESIVENTKDEILAAVLTAIRHHTPRPVRPASAVHSEMREALERSVVALDDWLNVYASDLCDAGRVQEAQQRIGEYGTLSYIALVQEQNRKALATPAPRSMLGGELQ